MKQSKPGPKKPKHASLRIFRGRDRRAELRNDRAELQGLLGDAVLVILHPALFEKQVAA